MYIKSHTGTFIRKSSHLLFSTKSHKRNSLNHFKLLRSLGIFMLTFLLIMRSILSFIKINSIQEILNSNNIWISSGNRFNTCWLIRKNISLTKKNSFSYVWKRLLFLESFQACWKLKIAPFWILSRQNKRISSNSKSVNKKTSTLLLRIVMRRRNQKLTMIN